MDETKIWILSEFFNDFLEGRRNAPNGAAYEFARIHLYGDPALDTFLQDKKADYIKQAAELDAKYAAQKQAEADKITLEQSKIDEILLAE